MLDTELKALAEQAAQQEDQSEVQAVGSSEYTPPAAGFTVGRLVEYVELGQQPQRPYMGQPKKPAEEVRIVFDLLGPKNIHEVDKGGVKTKTCDRIVIILPKLLADKAKFFKLFSKMQDNRKHIRHMSQMLGDAFMLKVVHNKSADGNKTYANIRDSDGSWLVFPPVMNDPLNPEDTKALVVPPAISPLRLFLWKTPTKATWDSLYITGTYKVKDASGVEQEQSKNTIQDKIMSAVNYVDSPLYTMLSTEEIKEAIPDTAPAKPAKVKKAKSTDTDVKAALADLGLLA